MKVLDLINTSESAKELLLDRAVYLAREHGVENHVLCSSGPYVEVLRDHGVPVHVLDTPRDLRPFPLLSAYIKLVGLLRREQFDIIHSHGSLLGLLARLSRPFTRARIVHTVHGFHFHETMPPLSYRLYEGAEKLLLRWTDLALSQNEEDADLMRSWGSRTPIQKIGNGIPLPDVPFHYSATEKNEYRLACIARFEPVKNHGMLFRAFRRVLERGYRARLVCFGDGELQGEMKARAEELGISRDVEFLGYVDDVLLRLEGVDLNVLTSVKEGLPRALIEAMAVGVPSVATDVKGSREVLLDGVTGLLVPLGDDEALADAVSGLLADPDRREEMSRAGIERAKWFDERRVCDRLFLIYSECMEPAGAVQPVAG